MILDDSLIQFCMTIWNFFKGSLPRKVSPKNFLPSFFLIHTLVDPVPDICDIFALVILSKIQQGKGQFVKDVISGMVKMFGCLFELSCAII